MDLGTLRAELRAVRGEMAALRSEVAGAGLGAGFGGGAAGASVGNLIDYLALRRRDIRGLQVALARMGLSSLGRAEGHVRWSVAQVESVLARLEGDAAVVEAGVVTPEGAAGLLAGRTAALLGPERDGRRVRVMVTMPSEAAADGGLIRELLVAGMDVMRINCAHDDAGAWARMVGHLEAARRAEGRGCRVLMDLGGPKARTGAMRPGPEVVRWSPPRDAVGRLVRPALVWVTWAEGPGPEGMDAALPVGEGFGRGLRAGEVVELRDSRGHRRELVVERVGVGGVVARAERTAYVVPGTALTVRGRESAWVCRDLPRASEILLVREGDRIALAASAEAGGAGGVDEDGEAVAAVVPFTLPEAFGDVGVGQRVLLDDGKIETVVERASGRGLRLRVTRTRPGGAKLAADKGVNFPDADLRLPALTAKDREDLGAVARLADAVGLSFVRRAGDVEAARAALEARGARGMGVVLKIETRGGFENLPELLVAALGLPAAGVMIARGDLAVEMGYQRLAEVQEEILWLCEAAHVPVVWATQVLEGLAKKGQPSRSEVTDAAMGERAECVMLNKGPFVVEAVRTLDDILRRMAGHQSKKRALLRPLGVARRFGGEGG